VCVTATFVESRTWLLVVRRDAERNLTVGDY
jgi:hypothetical protein